MMPQVFTPLLTHGQLNVNYKQWGETFESEIKALECKNEHPLRRMYTLTDYHNYDVLYNPSTRKAEVRIGAEKHVIGWLVVKLDAPRKK